MPTRFEKYRMRDGVTPLAERYFNPLLQDLDSRLAGLEDVKIGYDDAVKALTDFGLLRINEALTPSMVGLNAALDDVEARRVELDTAISSVTQTLGEIVTRAYLDQALAAQRAAIDQTTTALTDTVDSRIASLEPLIYAAL